MIMLVQASFLAKAGLPLLPASRNLRRQLWKPNPIAQIRKNTVPVLFCTLGPPGSDQQDHRFDQPCIAVSPAAVEYIGNNQRRISVSVSVEAPIEAIWNVLANYEGLSDFLPGLAVCEVRDRWENGAQLFQIGEQNLALGIKFKAKGIINVHEKPLEAFPRGFRRDIDFEMIDGDFEVFKGTWRMEQGLIDVPQTILTYVVDVQPKAWLPVRLVEGRLSNEIQNNLVCVRNEVIKNHSALAT